MLNCFKYIFNCNNATNTYCPQQNKISVILMPFFVFCQVINTGIAQCFFTFYTCSALAAMFLTAFITASGLCIVYTHRLTPACNIRLCDICIRCQHFNSRIGSKPCCVAHCLDKVGTAVWINSMVASMVRNQ